MKAGRGYPKLNRVLLFPRTIQQDGQYFNPKKVSLVAHITGLKALWEQGLLPFHGTFSSALTRSFTRSYK